MAILFIRPSAGLTTAPELAALSVSDDQRQLKVHENGTDEGQVFNFRRVFGPAYPLASIYEEGCQQAVEDVAYGRGSRATVILGEGKSRLNAALFILRHALTTFLTQARKDSPLEVTLACLGDHSTLQQQLLERQVLTGTDSLKSFERSLPGALKAYSQAQAQAHASDISLLSTIHWVGQEDIYRVLVGPPNNVNFLQALHKHVTTQSTLTLRESKLLTPLRDIYPPNTRHADTQRIHVLLCLDFDVVLEKERLRNALKLLSYTESLVWPASHEEHNPIDETAVISAAIHYASVEQALKVQAALRDDLERLRAQLDQTSAALLAEKTRNGLHERELREKAEKLQVALNDALASNFNLQQEVTLLRSEVRRLQTTITHAPPPPHIEETLVATDLQSTRSNGPLPKTHASTPRIPAVDLGPDSLDSFLLEAARINRQLRLRGERIG
ncbi:hypothetical protein GMRT_15632 [Giardia muris]|uniref:Uncharacterized protein n=1 Tax=Giardia muris TaxID=5742 RepID=A0A4Z1T6L1_GIAMU|nr:hypothetical protein GMRT_15632 [Giardia muris]|eukprot:TNJ28777.1 hypothetical protein GMRT_15632 [Giardia muris]